MRSIILTIFLFLLSFLLRSQVNDDDSFFDGTYNQSIVGMNKVKRIDVVYNVNKQHYASNIFEFDENGLMRKQTYLDSNGKKVMEYMFNYDQHGGQSERIKYEVGLGKTTTVNFERQYDGGRLIKESSSDESIFTQHFYSTNGQKVESVTKPKLDTTTDIYTTIEYYYDKKGRLKSSRRIFCDSGNVPIPTQRKAKEYFYDDKGKVVKINEDDGVIYELEYNKKNELNLKKYTKYYTGGSFEWVHTYIYHRWD
jgi:hypothetical protein